MVNFKKLFVVLMVPAILLSDMVSLNVKVENEKDDSGKKTVSQAYVDKMNPGWNLGNTFDSFDTGGDRGETSWGNPPVTKELIKAIKDQGFNSIRMPFTSVMRTGDAPDYKIDEEFLNRYAEVVKWALDEGLYVVVNLHHDSWNWAYNIGSDDGDALEKFSALWTQLAEYFKNYPEQLSFEALNEPYFNGETETQLKILDTVNRTFYQIVRESGGMNATRMLLLPTLNTNDSEDRCASLYETIQSLNDENIIATFHYYGYWPFSTNIAGTTTMDATVVSELEAAFDRVYNQFTAKGIGTICGEYGLLGFDKSLGAVEHGEVLKYFEYINYYAKQKNIPLMLWDNGQHMNRTTYEWSDPTLYNTIKASWTGRSSYTETDRIFISGDESSKDITVKMIFNGNRLKSIHDGDRYLVRGEDYLLERDILTLKGSYIESILTDKYGQNAALKFQFSSGADWNLFINRVKKPVAYGAIGDSRGFSFTVNFNGDVLTTLEAAYEDGSGAGPQNWTTYKEYDYAFHVDYGKNKVILTDKFFAETKDGEVYLTLHFQSGEMLKYKIRKIGNRISGSRI